MNKQVVFFLLILINSVHLSFSQSEIVLENYFRNLKSIKVTIDNKEYNFLFDTGAGITIVSPKILEIINKKQHGRSVGYRMNGERVEMMLCDSIQISIGGKTFLHPTVGVFDVMTLLPKDFKPLDGVISLKTFENSLISLQLNKDKIIIETKKSFRKKVKKAYRLSSKFANGLTGQELNIFLAIQQNDKPFWFLLDSGNIAATIISDSASKSFYTPNKKNGFQSGLKLGNEIIISNTIIKDIIYDGALSFEFIKQSEFLISFPEKKIHLIKDK